MKAPMILPWLARRWGVSDARALELWRQACSDADVATMNRAAPEYWGFAKARLIDLLDKEVLSRYPATDVYGQMINLSVLRLVAQFKFWLAARKDALSFA